MRTRLWAIGLTILLFGAAIGVAACGGDDESGSASSGSGAQAPKVESLKVIISSDLVDYAAAYIPALTGIAKEEGLDLTVENAGLTLNTVMASGKGDVALSSAIPGVAPAKEGLETSLIFGNLAAAAATYTVGTVPTIQDCTKMSTTIEGTTSYGNSQLLKQGFGLDYSLITAGDVATASAAIVSGSADCGMQVQSVWAAGIADGKYKLIFDPLKDQLPADYPKAALAQVFWGVKSRLEEKRSAVTKFMKAVNRAYTEVLTPKTPEEIVQILRKQPALTAQPEKPQVESMRITKQFQAPNDGYISDATWAATSAFMKAAGLGYIDDSDKWSYGSRVDMSYYENAIGKPTS